MTCTRFSPDMMQRPEKFVQKWLSFWKVTPFPQNNIGFLVTSLIKVLLPRSRRVLLPRWAERIFPGNLSRSVYIVEDSIVDPKNRRLTTLTWNLNHSKLMMVVERCVFYGERDRPVWTRLTREAWISSGVVGLSRPIQEFGLSRFKSNQTKAMKGLEHALSKLHISGAQSHHGDTSKDAAEKAKNLTKSSSSQKSQEFV
ncbi:PRELI domain-containing protein 1, mitochondrial-like [Hoplias malabaricus]|uniref:PRELI domain-containing protein 1, mitochondrial-like n=1 Tax=Hoplias malabaricus TaxID=27720 RepID=UPI00346230D6